MHGDKVIFESRDSLYNMAVGEAIVSAFNGPADLKSFNLISHSISATPPRPKESSARARLENYYEQVRQYREGTNTTISRNKVFREIRERFPEDWLLSVELYELAQSDKDKEFAREIEAHLETVKQRNPELGHLIDDGLGLANIALVG
jgi:phenylalanine-4-hydroxylase